jgi:hypothetical protein
MTPQGLQLALTVGFVLVLAYIFAKVEIHIEGDAGWAANLPTWRIESHWLLDVLWGGRAMTGYHAWVFPFIALSFHGPIFFTAAWSWQMEARIIAAIMLFWIAEDFLWFIINPAFGLRRFRARFVPWHKHWVCGAPVDYWIFSCASAALFAYSY